MTENNRSIRIDLPEANDIKGSFASGNDVGQALKYSVFGCGGTGRSCATRFAKEHNEITVETIDTTSNHIELPNLFHNHIAGLDGSAADRGMNYDSIREFIVQYVAGKTFEPMNIVVCSLAGGSGSMIGPLLVKEIRRSGAKAIMLTIADTKSDKDARNTIGALKTIEGVLSGMYVPMVLFHNKFGQQVVDRGVDEVLNRLDVLFNNQFDRLDTADRLMFFSPSDASVNVQAGVRLLNISTKEDGTWEEDLGLIYDDEKDNTVFVDSSLVLSSPNYTPNSKMLSNINYHGLYIEERRSPLMFTLGYTIPSFVISEINELLVLFSQQGKIVKKNNLSLDAGLEGIESHDDGVVF